MTKTVANVRKVIFLLPLFRASPKMRRSPRLAHKAPVMQATKKLRQSKTTGKTTGSPNSRNEEMV